MRVLVTGGTGYIGVQLVDALCQAGRMVRVLDLRPPDPRRPGVDYVVSSMADPAAVARAMQDVEAVYHLAWRFLSEASQPEFQPELERREIQENLFGTLNLLEAALAARVRQFVFASSAAVYGPTGPEKVDEEHPCHPERSTIGGPVYGITKLACEKYCLAYHHRGLPVTILRIHGVFSEGNLGQFETMIEQTLAGKPVQAFREAGGQYAYIDDVLKACLLVLDNPSACGGVFNLAGTHTYRDPELARFIVNATGSKTDLALIDDPGQGMISVSVGKLCRLLGHQPTEEEFLPGLIRQAIEKPRDSAKPPTRQ